MHRSFIFGGLNIVLNWRTDFKRFPFFGFVTRRGNNFGMVTPTDLPLEKRKKDYVIGILGGSVAGAVGDRMLTGDFARRLQKVVPELKSKNIILVNMAVAAYRQPQQFFVFSYFLESLDAVIQVDGWNEAWVTGGKQFPIDFPAFSEVLYSSNDKVLGLVSDLSMELDRFYRTVKYLAHSKWLSKSSTLFLAMKTWRLQLHLRGQDVEALAVQDVEKPFYIPPLSAPVQAQRRVASWLKYLKLESEMAKSAKIKRFFFIQPSQYAEGSKSLTEREKQVAYLPGNEWGGSVFAELRASALP